MDIVFIIFLTVISFTIFCLSLFCLLRNYFSIDYLYLILPLIFFSFWAFHCIYYLNTQKYEEMGKFWDGDFPVFYNAGKQILKNPAYLYEVPRYFYMPSFAIFCAFTFSLLPFRVAYYTFYFTNYLAGMLAILEFDRILLLLDVKKKAYRLFFLTIISNGYLIWVVFYLNHLKFLVFLILLFIIRREIQYRKEAKTKNIKYYILTFGLFVFLLGIAPYFIFLLFIYVFQQIKLKNILKKENLKMYFIIISWFVIQNITFIIYPLQIVQFIDGFNRPVRESRSSHPLFLQEFIYISPSEMTTPSLIFTGILAIIAAVLILYRNEKIENKFSLFLLSYIFFGIISPPFLIVSTCFSFVLFLFVPFLNQEVEGYEFLKKNIIVLIGLASILGIALFINDFFNYVFFPAIHEQDFGILETYRLLVLHTIMLSCICSLYIRKYKLVKKENIERTKFAVLTDDKG